VAVPVATSSDVVRIFFDTAAVYGLPRSVLSANGAIYTTAYRGSHTGMEIELATLGIVFKHGKPYHPQTQGKVCEHCRDAASGRSDPGQGMTKVSSARFVDRIRRCVMARAGRTALT
jgi:hypothetical protein